MSVTMRGAVGIGEFGSAVQDELIGAGWLTVASEPSDWTSIEFLTVASWRETPSVFEQADRWAFENRRPWLPVVMDHPHLRVGPYIVPDATACYQCYLRRRFQHDEAADSLSRLWSAYDGIEGIGPTGFTTYHVSMTAAIVQRLASTTAVTGSPLGEIILFNTQAPDIATLRPLSMSDCARCRQRVEVRSTDFAEVVSIVSGSLRL